MHELNESAISVSDISKHLQYTLDFLIPRLYNKPTSTIVVGVGLYTLIAFKSELFKRHKTQAHLDDEKEGDKGS